MAQRWVLLIGAVAVAAAIGAPGARTVMAPGHVPEEPPAVVVPPGDEAPTSPQPVVVVDAPDPVVTPVPTRYLRPKGDPPSHPAPPPSPTRLPTTAAHVPPMPALTATIEPRPPAGEMPPPRDETDTDLKTPWPSD